MFDPVAYMQTLCNQLNATAGKYTFARVSGIAALEEVLENSRRSNSFFAIDDSEDGITFRGAGATYFERRPYTVFLVAKAEYGDMDARASVLAETRAIYRSILSRLIKDKRTITVLDCENIRFFEVAPAFATGCAGIYFIFYVENPVNLVYDATAWTT